MPLLVSMPKWFMFCVALLCLVCVVVICVAPDVDLPDTVVRAKQLALLLLLATLAFAGLWTGGLLTSTSRPSVDLAPPESAQSGRFLSEPTGNCVFRC